MLQCMSPLLARLGSAWLRESIPLTGVKQTAMQQYRGAVMQTIDPNRTFLIGQKYLGALFQGFIETSRQVQVRRAALGIQFSGDRVPVTPVDAGLRALHDGRGDFEDVAMDVHYAPSLASNARLRSTPQR